LAKGSGESGGLEKLKANYTTLREVWPFSFDAIIPFNKFEIFVEEGERKWKKREKKEKQQNF